MRLIIAEKHSVAQAIASAIGGMQTKQDGFIECPGNLITWAQGHLIDLDAPDAYKSRGWDKWSLDTLPIDPSPDWQWHVNQARGADKQYRKVERLLKRSDVTELVNACDPDREVFKCSSIRGQKQADGTWKDVTGCGFKIFSTVAGKTLTSAQVQKILGGRKVAVKGFTSKAGKKFDANLILDKDRGVSFDFGK